MFFGEVLCMVAFYVGSTFWNSKVASVCFFSSRFFVSLKPLILNSALQPERVSDDWSPLIFFLPALCDCTATTMMYSALNFTTPSNYQMLRGSVVIFTGMLSWYVTGVRPLPRHWTGMLLVLVGLICVGLSSQLFSSSSSSASNPSLGNVLVIAASVVAALQMVTEEKFFSKVLLRSHPFPNCLSSPIP